MPRDKFRQWVERSGDSIILLMRTDAGTHFRRSVKLESAEGDVLVQLEETLKATREKEEWELEQKVFQAANDPNNSLHVRELLKELWAQFVERGEGN